MDRCGTSLIASTFAALLRVCCRCNAGLLIEANPSTYAKLLHSGRKARLINSAICDADANEGQTVRMLTNGGSVASLRQFQNEFTAWRWHAKWNTTVRHTGKLADWLRDSSNTARYINSAPMQDIPCQSLRSLMAQVGLPRAHFLSLDVEEAEEMVMLTVDPSAFKLAVVEATSANVTKDKRVEGMFIAAGLSRKSQFRIHWNQVYASPFVPMADLYPEPIGWAENAAKSRALAGGRIAYKRHTQALHTTNKHLKTAAGTGRS